MKLRLSLIAAFSALLVIGPNVIGPGMNVLGMTVLSMNVLGSSVLAQSIATDPLRDRANRLFQVIPAAPPPYRGEAATAEKVALGKMLYFDARISENYDLSCNTCHNIGMGGGDGRATEARGHAGELAGRKVPTVFNAVFNTAQFWDGRADNLEEQVEGSVMAFPGALFKTRGGPIIVNPELTSITKIHVVERLKALPGYVDAFKKAFPTRADPIVYADIANAIAVFESTLITPGAPFDLWLEGNEAALDDRQKHGLLIFIEKGCVNCHNGINIGGNAFARFGVMQTPRPELLPNDDWGRFAVTRDITDKYVFKVPGLRNVALTAPYFHTGHVWSLQQAVAVMAETQLGQKLTDSEIEAIVAFLESLTGRQPEIILPILPPRVTSTQGRTKRVGE
jgi:cytochrome c peroxidase